MSVLCLECRAVIENTEGLNACPNCGGAGIPAQLPPVTIEITWHELRVLTIWAEFWASHHTKAKEAPFDRDKPVNMVEMVWKIAHAIEAQHPDRPALTLSGELKEVSRVLADDMPSVRLETNIPIEPEPES